MNLYPTKHNRKLVFATNNRHKFGEIQVILNNRVELVSLSGIGCTDEIPEDHETLDENAAQKAFYVYHKFGVDCFADDTGLEIEALHGEPGVYSARYAGEKCSFVDNMNLVLLNMKGIENRKARFRTVIALVENGQLLLFEGVINGHISTDKRGMNGFGYDPIFIPEGSEKTFAEMSATEKNADSHRSRAIEAFGRHFLTIAP
jgi:XTP/dITP diphosphohydrolase